ncbi:MAG: sugar transferase [Bacteroidota bacterium]
MKSRYVYKYTLMLIDGVVLYGILTLFSVYRTELDFVTEYWYRAILPMVLTWIVLEAIGGYNIATDMQSLSYTSRHILAMPVVIALTVFTVYLFSYKPSLQFSRSVLPAGFLTFLFTSLLYRRLINRLLSKARKKRYFAIIGTGEQAQELYRSYKESSIEQSLRFFDENDIFIGKPIDDDTSPLIEGNMLESISTSKELCDGIVVTETKIKLHDELFSKLVKFHFTGVPLIPIRAFYEQNFRKMPVFVLNQWWLIEDDLLIASDPIFRRIKNVIDRVLALFLLIITLPLVLIIAVAIALDSKGGIIYKQLRMGMNEVPFTMYKFRTMTEHSDEGDKYVRKEDRRVTRIGRILRLMRLDELPQLVNVLRGEMSLIGPRAEWIEIIREYEKKIQYYHFRHIVRPGITGWAQVNYKYGENIQDTIEKLQYDLYYISHYSLLLDFDIILKTLYVMVFGKGR